MQHQQLLLAALFTFAMVVVVHGAPAIQYQPPETHTTRIFGNKNAARMMATNGDDGPTNDADEEEEELESLKSQKVVSASPTSSSSTSAPSTQASVNVKKPENEEKPAISDNANSLKFPHHNPGGFDESLFVKKSSHNLLSHDGLASSLKITTDEQQRNGLGGLLGDLLPGAGSGDRDRLNFQQVDYTPQDIAEYIFWTGDERGVAAAIGDFLQEGLVSREDAVRFLEDVKHELSNIRSRYTTSLTQGQAREQPSLFPNFNLFNSPPSMDAFKGYTAGMMGLNSPQFYPSTTKRENTYLQFPQPEITNEAPFFHGQPLQLNTGGGFGSNSNLLSVEELDYDEIAEKLRTVDAKMREYALEDIIYQIGKNLFTESLKNSPGDSTQKFSEFIEAQSASGKIPKDLEKDVMDVLVGAFVDAVDDRGVQQLELEHQLQEQRRNSPARYQNKQNLLVTTATTTPNTNVNIHGAQKKNPK